MPSVVDLTGDTDDDAQDVLSPATKRARASGGASDGGGLSSGPADVQLCDAPPPVLRRGVVDGEAGEGDEEEEDEEIQVVGVTGEVRWGGGATGVQARWR